MFYITKKVLNGYCVRNRSFKATITKFSIVLLIVSKLFLLLKLLGWWVARGSLARWSTDYAPLFEHTGFPVAVTSMQGMKSTTTVAVRMPTQFGGDAANFVQICKANHLQ